MLPEDASSEADPALESGSGVDRASGLIGSCPLPISDYREIVLAHGSGGKLSQQLIQKLILPQFRNDLLDPLHDGAVFSVNGARLAFSTDSYVVSPIFFPGGSIGTLAVHGTVNDLGDVRRAPAVSFGGIHSRRRHADSGFLAHCSIDAASGRRCRSALVTGDTKVVDRGKADKIFINTSGSGIVPDGVNIHPDARAARRQDSAQRSDRRSWHRHHVRARGIGVRNGNFQRHRVPGGTRRDRARREQEHSCLSRSDARRRDERAQRNRPVCRASACS